MPRLSIINLMRYVLALAIGLAALRNANEFWAGATLCIAIGLLGVALLGVIYQVKQDRAWWVGFAIFEGGYLLVSFGPWFAEQIQPELGTTQFLRYVHSLAGPDVASPPSGLTELLDLRTAMQMKTLELQKKRAFNDPEVLYLRDQEKQIDNQIYAIQGFDAPISSLATKRAGRRATNASPWGTLFPGSSSSDEFLRVGHCLFAILAGLAGALIACRFHSRREYGGGGMVAVKM